MGKLMKNQLTHHFEWMESQHGEKGQASPSGCSARCCKEVLQLG